MGTDCTSGDNNGEGQKTKKGSQEKADNQRQQKLINESDDDLEFSPRHLKILNWCYLVMEFVYIFLISLRVRRWWKIVCVKRHKWNDKSCQCVSMNLNYLYSKPISMNFHQRRRNYFQQFSSSIRPRSCAPPDFPLTTRECVRGTAYCLEITPPFSIF